MSKRASASERWRRIVAEQTTSGLSIAVYCRQAGIPQSSFYAWRRKLGRDGPATDQPARESAPAGPSTFAAVQLAAEPARSCGDAEFPAAQPRRALRAPQRGAIEVRLAGGRGIVVRPGFDRQTLQALIEVLESAALKLEHDDSVDLEVGA